MNGESTPVLDNIRSGKSKCLRISAFIRCAVMPSHNISRQPIPGGSCPLTASSRALSLRTYLSGSPWKLRPIMPLCLTRVSLLRTASGILPGLCHAPPTCCKRRTAGAWRSRVVVMSCGPRKKLNLRNNLSSQTTTTKTIIMTISLLTSCVIMRLRVMAWGLSSLLSVLILVFLSNL